MEPNPTGPITQPSHTKKYVAIVVLAIVAVAIAVTLIMTSKPSGLSAQVVSAGKKPASLLCAKLTSPWVQVVSPNGGEVYQQGQQVLVTWKNCNTPNQSALIGLWSSQTGTFDEIATVNNSGSATVTLPLTLGAPAIPTPEGTFYKILVAPGGSSTLRDSSDGLFSIVGSATAAGTSGNPTTAGTSSGQQVVTITVPQNTSTASAVSMSNGSTLGVFSMRLRIMNNATESVQISSACRNAALPIPQGTVPGALYAVENSSGQSDKATSTCMMSSTGYATSAGDFILGPSEVQTFTISSMATPLASGAYRMTVPQVRYMTQSGVIGSVSQDVTGAPMRTPFITLAP